MCGIIKQFFLIAHHIQDMFHIASFLPHTTDKKKGFMKTKRAKGLVTVTLGVELVER